MKRSKRRSRRAAMVCLGPGGSMETRKLRLIIILSLLAVMTIFFVPAGPAAAIHQESGNKETQDWRIMPRVGVGVEYGGFILRDGDFSSALRRRVEVDALQYRRHIIYLEFDEETSWGIPADRWEFNRMRHRLYMIGYRYDLGNHYLGLFFHHRCHNPFHTEKFQGYVGRSRENIYFVGMEFLSKSMRLGMKDQGINFESGPAFEFLGRWHYWLSVLKTVEKDKSNLNWLLRAQVRLDLLRYYWLIPYLEVGSELLIRSSGTRLSPWGEGGIRCRLRDKMDFTPFLRGGRSQEEIIGDDGVSLRPVAHNFLFGGARLEFLLDEYSVARAAQAGQMHLLPEIHGTLDYGLYLKSRFFNGRGKMELDFEVLRYDPWTFFLYTDLGFDTRKTDFKPDKVTYRLQYGLTYMRGRYFAEAFLDHSRRLDSDTFRNVSERANLAGLRLGTKGMKPGHVNDGISFAPETFQWLHNLNVQANAGHFFDNRDWQYLWNVAAQARWDFLRWRFIIPYLQGELNWLAGGGSTKDAFEYAVEPGLRFHGIFDLALYYRFQHRENVTRFQGPSESQSVVGLKAFF